MCITATAVSQPVVRATCWHSEGHHRWPSVHCSQLLFCLGLLCLCAGCDRTARQGGQCSCAQQVRTSNKHHSLSRNSSNALFYQIPQLRTHACQLVLCAPCHRGCCSKLCPCLRSTATHMQLQQAAPSPIIGNISDVSLSYDVFGTQLHHCLQHHCPQLPGHAIECVQAFSVGLATDGCWCVWAAVLVAPLLMRRSHAAMR